MLHYIMQYKASVMLNTREVTPADRTGCIAQQPITEVHVIGLDLFPQYVIGFG